MTLLRTHHSLRRGTIATAVVVSLFAPMTTAVAADAVNTKLSRIVLGIGSDATEANVAWQSKTNELQYLEYWPSDNAADKTSVESPRGQYNGAVFYPHEATMTGLEPDTEYVYRVGNDDRGWSEERTFTTGEDSDSWSFLAMADAQIGVDAKIDEQSAAWNKAVNVATGEHPDSAFLMHLGDQVEGWGAAVKQLEEFTAPEALQNYRLAVLKGNHETYTSDRHFQDTYFLPNEDGASANYFFNYNNILFIGLDGNRSSAADIEAHAKFVNDAIADHGADADWVMVGIHQAPFSQGTHYTDRDVVRLREQLTPKLSEAGVDLVLSGHDHIYTRTHLMNGFDPVIPEGAAKSGDVLIPEDGEVLYLTSTTATGGKYYDFQDESGETHPNIREERARDLAHDSTARWRQDYNPDYTNIEVSPSELKLTTYNINTPYVVDQVTLQKKDAKKPEETTKPSTEQKPTSEQKPTTEQKPAPEVVTTTQTSEKLVPTTKTSVGTATVTETSVQTSPATKTVENTKTVPTTVKETVTETSTVKVPTTITKSAEPTKTVPTTVKETATKNAEPEVTTVTSVGTATVTETSTQTAPETKVVEKTKTVPTTVTETITKNAEPQEPAGDSDSDSTGKDAAGSVSGSSTGGIILTVLAILIAVLGAIFAALSYVHPQWIQDIRKQFNI